MIPYIIFTLIIIFVAILIGRRAYYDGYDEGYTKGYDKGYWQGRWK